MVSAIRDKYEKKDKYHNYESQPIQTNQVNSKILLKKCRYLLFVWKLKVKPTAINQIYIKNENPKTYTSLFLCIISNL